MFASKLKTGDKIRVLAPSLSLSMMLEEKFNKALSFLEGKGFKVTFSKHCRETDEWKTSSITSRVEDIHDRATAFTFFQKKGKNEE